MTLILQVYFGDLPAHPDFRHPVERRRANGPSTRYHLPCWALRKRFSDRINLIYQDLQNPGPWPETYA